MERATCHAVAVRSPSCALVTKAVPMVEAQGPAAISAAEKFLNKGISHSHTQKRMKGRRR
jgi:hypothetical protein